MRTHMKKKWLTLLGSVAIISLLILNGCQKQFDPINENLETLNEVSALTSPSFSTSFIGQSIQEFEQIKNAASEATRLQQNMPGTDFSPTGFYAPPNSTLVINVQQLTGTERPQVLIGTYSRYTEKWDPQTVSLSNGTNNISVDSHGGIIWIRYGTSGTPNSSVQLTFESGHLPMPVWIKGVTTNAQWISQISSYSTVPDVLLVGDRTYMVYSRSRAQSTQTQDNDHVLSTADFIIDAEDDFSGLDGSSPLHERNQNYHTLMTESNGTGWMFASWYRTWYVTDAAPAAFTPAIGTSDGWGPWHEIGHMHQQTPWTWEGMMEVTVNLYSLAAERALGVAPSRLVVDNIWPQASAYLEGTTKDYHGISSVWVKLYMMHQLWLAYGDSFYHNLHKITREEAPVVSTNEQKMRYFMLKSCQISGYDLTLFFQRWGMNVPASVYTEIAALSLPKPTVEPSTLNDLGLNGIQSGSDYKIITAINNSSALDVSGNGTADGTPVILYSPHTGNNQKWKITKVDDQYYSIQPLHAPTKALSVKDGGTANSTPTEIKTYTGANSQKWKINATGDGYYRLVPAHASNRQLDVNGGSSANSTPINIYSSHIHNSQKFKLELQ